MTEAPKNATTGLAAPETDTVRTAGSDASTESQRGQFPAPPVTAGKSDTGVTAEGGSNPPRSAAKLSQPSRADQRRPFDLIDHIQGQVGTIDPTLIKEASPDWKPIGAARKLFKKGGTPADSALNALGSGHGVSADMPIDEFGDAINAAANARKGWREQFYKQDRQINTEAKQTANFHNDIVRAPKGTETLVPDDLNEGDEFTLKGAKVKVAKLEYDEDGRVTHLTLEDGKQYGTQEVDGGTALRMDSGSLKKAGGDEPEGHNAAFATGDFSFDRAESTDEQKARLAREQQAAAADKAKQAMLAKAAKPLVGKDLDTTGDIFAKAPETRTDKSGQQSMFAKGEKGTGRGLSIEDATDAVHSVLGTKGELPAGIKVVRDEGATWGAKIEGRNKITVNAAQISTPERARAVILEEGLHGVWSDPAVQKAWQSVRDLVTPEEMAEESNRRKAQGLPADPATIREEAAVARMVKADASRGVFARVLDVARNVFNRIFGFDLPGSDRQQLKNAAINFLRNRDQWDGAKGETQPVFAKGEKPESFQGASPIHPVDQAELDRLQKQHDDLVKQAQTTGDYSKVRGVQDEMNRLMQGQQPRTMSFDSLKARNDAIQQRLGELSKATTTADKGERYALKNEMRAIDKELLTRPEHIADLLKQQDAKHSAAMAAKQRGDTPEYNRLMDDLAAEANNPGNPLAKASPELVDSVRKSLEASGQIRKVNITPTTGGRTLGSLTDYLEANKIDSPKLSLADRFNLAKRLADQYQGAKDAIAKGAAKMSAMWDAFKAQYKGPPVDGNFRSLVKDWLYDKQVTGLETHRWVEQIKSKVPDKLRRQAISAFMDAGGDLQTLRDQADAVPARFKPIWDTALKLTPDEQKLAQRITADFEQKLSDAQMLGLVDKGRENYGVPQIWKEAPKSEGEFNPFVKKQTARNPTAKLDARSPFFSLQRNNPTYFDGIMKGGIPDDMDVGKLVGTYNADFHNSLSDRGLIWQLKDGKTADGSPLAMIGGKTTTLPAAEGGRTYFSTSHYRPVDAMTPDGRPYQTVDHWALRDWRFSSTDKDGNPIMVNGDFYIHPDHAAFLKNELGQSWMRDPDGGAKYFKPVIDSAAYIKKSMFAGGTFHAATEALHAAFHGISPLVKDVDLDPQTNHTLALGIRNGLDMGFGAQREMFEEGVGSHGGVWGHVPGVGDALQKIGDFTFSYFIPRIKAKTFAAVYDRNAARYPDLSPDRCAEVTARQVNAAFGGQNWRLMGANKTLMDVSRLLLVAPDFLLSRSKVVAQALKPYGAEQRHFLLAQAATVYLGARALNMILNNGNPHMEPDNAFRVVNNGRSYGARFIVSDLMEFLAHPGEFAAGRLSPFSKVGIEATTERDMRTGAREKGTFNFSNDTLRRADILVSELAKSMVPIGFSGLLPGAAGKEQTGAGQLALSQFGVGSRKYTAETQMYDKARAFNESSKDTKTQAYQQRREDDVNDPSQYRQLDALLLAGKTKEATDEYQALLKEGVSADSAARRYNASPRFTGQGAWNNPTTREGKFFASLSPLDQQTYRQAIQERKDLAAKFQAMPKR